MAGINIAVFTYPTVLTDADWQRKKGTIGKLHKTGLGAALLKAEALWKKVDRGVLDPASTPAKSMDELEQRLQASRNHYKAAVEPLRNEMANVRTSAKAAEAILKKAVGGTAAAKAAADVEKAAELFQVTCKSLDLEAAVAKVKADIQKKDQLAAQLLAGAIAKFNSGAQAFLAKPSAESWGTNIKQQGRSVSNSVAQLATLRAKFWAEFEKFKGFDLDTLKLGSTDKMVEVVKRAVVQVKAIADYKQ